MNRSFTRLSAVLTAATSAVGMMAGPVHAGPRTAAANTRPNILMFLMDDARYGTTWVMSKSTAWLGAGGSYFPGAVVATPSCGPSRGSIMSGRFAHNTHLRHQADLPNLDQNKTVEHDLKAAGYRTAAVGKLFNNINLSVRPPSFDNWSLTGGGYVNAHFVVDGRSTTTPYSTSFIGDRVNAYVNQYESNDAQPWFIYAGFTSPHDPNTAEPKYANVSYPWSGNPATAETDRSDKPAYVRNFAYTLAEGTAERQAQLRTMRSVDDAIESVRRNLAARGELENTLVILYSDNGKFWGEHGLREKFMPYLVVNRVPLYLWWPGHIPATTDNRLADSIDLAPTMLQAAGVSPTYQVDGRSLLRSGGRSRALMEYWRDTANCAGCPSGASTYVPGRYLYTELYQDNGSLLDHEYYNLATDPWELTNLFRDGNPNNNPADGPLRAALAAQRACVGTTACT